MKWNFNKTIPKSLGVAMFATLLGATAINVSADESEIYQAALAGANSKPQVLIILDTSSHMRKKVSYPYPEVYDPFIAYPPTSDTVGNSLVNSVFGADKVYFSTEESTEDSTEYSAEDSTKSSAKDYNKQRHAAAEKQLAEYNAYLSREDKTIPFNISKEYKDFVETIPGRSGNFIRVEEMNCNAAVSNLDSALGAYSDYLTQWNSNLALYSWTKIKPSSGLFDVFLTEHVECKQDLVNNDPKNPGFEHKVLLSVNSNSEARKDIADGEIDGYAADTDRQGFPNANKYTGWLNIPKKKVWWKAYDKNKTSFNDIDIENDDDDKPPIESYKTTLYSENLVKWAALKTENKVDTNNNFTLSQLQIAKKIIYELMLNTEDVDIGLEIFNSNEGKGLWDLIANNHGGRIISGIQPYDTETSRSLLRNRVGDILTTRINRSALCESLYEGYLYLYGQNMEYGNKFSTLTKPMRDRSVEDKGKYKNPLKEWSQTCQTKAYVIIISPGYHDITSNIFNWIKCWGINDHDHDKDANSKIKSLPGVDLTRAITIGNDCKKNYLPVLSHWLANNDINDKTPEKEHIVTYTIGLGSIEPTYDTDGNLIENSTATVNLPIDNKNLLLKTAEGGGGKFYNAMNANQLRDKLNLAIDDMRAKQGVVTAVETSTNTSNVTKNKEYVYYSMFAPNQTSKWSGNLRKLKIDNGVLSAWSASASAASTLSTALTKPAISEGLMFFNDDLYSGWSDTAGLNDVKIGGVAEALKNRTEDRNLYMTDSTNSNLVLLNKTNLLTVFGVSDDVDLANKIGVSEVTLDDAIRWLQGKNESGEFRDDIFGDPMHSSPLAVDYSDGNTRIFIGTNAGFFHAFKDDATQRKVTEEWAFIPKENIHNALKLYLGSTTMEDRIYGIDSSPVLARSGSDHIITFGMRRGGNTLYSLTVNLEDGVSKPELNWLMSGSKNEDDIGTKVEDKIGQTWSTPVVTKVMRNKTQSDNDKPVLIFGGGYDVKKDECGAVVNNSCEDDAVGNAIFIVDADSGDIIKKFSSTISGSISGSIASQVAVLDSNGDGYTDRIYAPDTSGNIYRADMPSVFKIDNIDFDTWKMITLASLGGTGTDDRRFFNPPSIVRTIKNGIAYDGLLIGSGDITRPNSDLTVDNYFFNIQDTYTAPANWERGKAPSTILISNLSEVTYSFKNNKSHFNKVKNLNLAGWRFKLGRTNADKTTSGEKSLGDAVVVNGIVHFNAYTPYNENNNNGEQCGADKSGTSTYYSVNLLTGMTFKKPIELPNVLAKSISVHASSVSGASILRLLGVGKGDSDKSGNNPTGTIETDMKLEPHSTYRYFNEAAQ